MYEDLCKFKGPTTQHGIGYADGDPLNVLSDAETKSRFLNPSPSVPASDKMIIKLATLTE